MRVRVRSALDAMHLMSQAKPPTMMRASLRRLQADIRQRLQSHGTDVDMNDDDPTGDGDQSPILLNHAGKQIYRDLFAEGGDIAQCGQAGQISSFVVACVQGNVTRIERLLIEADNDEARLSDKLIELLETRQTSMRLSPLLMIVSAGKNILPQTSELSSRQVQVARILLKYGARPDAKDVCGKTVCHYGAGVMATTMTMEIVSMCIQAAESSHLLNKEVELNGLKNETMNGKRGIARGFDTTTSRRAVYVIDEEKLIAVKPDNIRLCDAQDTSERPKLCDVQDRLGMVSLTEVMMTNREDVAKFLLDKHNARIDIADWDGFSPQQMAMSPGAELTSASVAKLIKLRVTKEGRAKAKAAKRHCSHCGIAETQETPLSRCMKCKSVQYCSKDCQTKDWKEGGHKKACMRSVAERDQTVVLEQPVTSFLPGGSRAFSASIRTGLSSEPEPFSFRKPSYASVGQKFYVKVQAGGAGSPLFIYDRNRECQFYYLSGQRGYADLLEKVNEEKAFAGKKTYLAASFDEAGNCVVYLGSATLKKW